VGTKKIEGGELPGTNLEKKKKKKRGKKKHRKGELFVRGGTLSRGRFERGGPSKRSPMGKDWGGGPR